MSLPGPRDYALDTARRLQILEQEEGTERRVQIEKWAHQGPWNARNWLRAYDDVKHHDTRWEILRMVWQLGLGPGVAIEISMLLDEERRSRIQNDKASLWITMRRALLLWFMIVGVLTVTYYILERIF